MGMTSDRGILMKTVSTLKLFMGIFAAFVFCNFLSPTKTNAAYVYTSKDYGYSIECPQKPLGVIPLIDPIQKGEVLVFQNDGYNILQGWIIATNAFDSAQLPNFDKMTAKEAQTYAANFVANSNGRYVSAQFLPVKKHKILYAVGPQDVFVDANAKDSAAKPVVSQRIETYIPGKKTNYVIVSFKTGDMTDQDRDNYKNGITSFQEISNTDVEKSAKADLKQSKIKHNK